MIRGFVFAITWGIVVGTYSSVYIAKNIVLMLGVKRDWSKPGRGGDAAGTQFKHHGTAEAGFWPAARPSSGRATSRARDVLRWPRSPRGVRPRCA